MTRLVSAPAAIKFQGGQSKFHNTTRRELDERTRAEFDAIPEQVKKRDNIKIMSDGAYRDLQAQQEANRAQADKDRDRTLRKVAADRLHRGVRSGELSDRQLTDTERKQRAERKRKAGVA